MDRIFTMDNDTISTPVKSPSGYHVLRRLDHQSPGVPPLAEIFDEVEERFLDEQAGRLLIEKFKSWSEEVKKYNSLKDFASQVEMEDRLTTEVEARAVDIPDLGDLGEHAPYLATLEPGRLSELIPVPATRPLWLCALEIVEEKESYLPGLDEVRGEVENRVREIKGREAARQAAEAAYQAIKSRTPFDVANEPAPVQIAQTEPFKREETGQVLPARLHDFGKETLRIVEGSVGLSPYGPDADAPEGFAVWQVVNLEPPPHEDFVRDRYTFEREYLPLLQVTLVEEWLADQRREVEYEVLSASGLSSNP
jgi:hypothetical protein